MSRYRIDGMDSATPTIVEDATGAYGTYRDASIAILDHQHQKLTQAEQALMWAREQARTHANARPVIIASK